MRVVSAAEVAAAVSPAAAVQAITAALRTSFDPADDPARGRTPLPTGEFLIMPSAVGEFAGVKIATVAPGNPAVGLPRIQASYVLFDSATLAPIAVLDGLALTSLRTAAVSIAAVLPFLEALPSPPNVVVFGNGPAAHAHLATLPATLVSNVARIGRERNAVTAALLAAADVVICATTAREPLFDSAAVSDHAIVIAIGSHEPEARELDEALLRRSSVIVEDVATARREAGDVILAEAAGGSLDLIPLKRAVSSPSSIPADRPIVFKSVGMSWEDLVIAAAVWRARPTHAERTTAAPATSSA